MMVEYLINRDSKFNGVVKLGLRILYAGRMRLKSFYFFDGIIAGMTAALACCYLLIMI